MVCAMAFRSIRCAALCFVFVVLSCAGVRKSFAGDAEAAVLGEYEVKAAFLFNFAQFVEWPDDAFDDSRSSIVIGILGDDPFGSIIEKTVAGKTVREKKFVIKRFQRVADVERCHILFVSSSEEVRLTDILDAVRSSSVLTVGEMERFAERGGIVNLTKEQNKIRLEINVEAAERAGLKISSKLLKLAKVVGGKSRGEES